MQRKWILVSLLGTLSLLGIACDGGDETPSENNAPSFPVAEAEQAVGTYKQLAHEVYKASASEAARLKTAVDAFVAAPDDAKFQALKQTWVEARVPYNQNDAFRFYGGPIDNEETGPEGMINGWPLDENFIDYTRDEAVAGIINNEEKFSTIDEGIISGENENGGEKNLSAGYHAIEFLLWGQDDMVTGTGAGKRPYTDYVDGGTAQNQARRRLYLQTAASLLQTQLEEVEAAWRPETTGNYASRFGVVPDEGSISQDGLKDAVANMIRGLGSLAKAELSGERMTVAIKSRSQEDEHSCFSDTTWNDLYGNAVGIQNVWLGQFQGKKLGPGLDSVFRKVDGVLADQITKDINDAVAVLKTLAENNEAEPFDVVITSPDGSAGRTKTIEAIKLLKQAADGLSHGAARLGLSIQLEQASEEL